MLVLVFFLFFGFLLLFLDRLLLLLVIHLLLAFWFTCPSEILKELSFSLTLVLLSFVIEHFWVWLLFRFIVVSIIHLGTPKVHHELAIQVASAS